VGREIATVWQHHAAEPWQWSVSAAQVQFVAGDGTVMHALRASVREGSQIATRSETLARERLGRSMASVDRSGNGGAVDDDFPVLFLDPQGSTVAAFLQVFRETVGMGVDFHVGFVFADRTFHHRVSPLVAIWLLIPKLLEAYACRHAIASQKNEKSS
jgi:hypothetical protein